MFKNENVEDKGVYIGMCIRTNQLVMLNYRKNKNCNCAILGTLGLGKNFKIEKHMVEDT